MLDTVDLKVSTRAAKLEAAISAAFRKLPIREEAEYLLPSMVSTLCNIPVGADQSPIAKLRLVGRGRTRKQLDAVAKASNKLSIALQELNQPAIIALADSGLLQTVHPDSLIRMLAVLERTALAVDLSSVPETQGGGAPVAGLTKGVANILANNYQRLTGKRPVVSWDAHKESASGPFYVLVVDVFKALKIRADARTAARDAARPYMQKTLEKTKS
ncbi:hypothetical protein [Caballeronia sordidicola]|nr:hypothetical protein [Caballeronia sordidicola]